MGVRVPSSAYYADLAQLVEQLICNQWVEGSNPLVGINRINCGSSSVVEHHLAMVGVAGSNPVFRLSLLCRGGGTGRRTGLKILRLVTTVPVRFRSSAYNDAPLAQLDRVSDYESEG